MEPICLLARQVREAISLMTGSLVSIGYNGPNEPVLVADQHRYGLRALIMPLNRTLVE